MKLSDDEQQELDKLEHALCESDPGLHRRLSRMRMDGLAPVPSIAGLLAGVVLGVALVTVGELLGILACLVAGLVLTATVPAVAVVWWARRYYCRYCAGKWPAPAGSCPRCARPAPA